MRSSYKASDPHIKEVLNTECLLIYSMDPSPVLEDMGLLGHKGTGYKGSNRSRIWFRDMTADRYHERTASASFSISRSGSWLFYDFGNETGDNIIGFVRKRLGVEFGEAFRYVTSCLGINSLFLELTSSLNRGNKTNHYFHDKKDEIMKKIEALNLENTKLHNSSTSHEVSYIANKIPKNKEIYLKLRDFLSARKLNPDKLPRGIYFIQGKTNCQDKDGRPKAVFRYGVGALNGNEEHVQIVESMIKTSGYFSAASIKSKLSIGADIHIVPYVTSSDSGGRIVKSKVYGSSGISIIKSNKASSCPDLAVFESKMDYYAASMAFENLDEFTILIANGIAGREKILNYIKSLKLLPERMIIFNQNDQPSERFAYSIFKESNIKKILMFKYKESGEEKMDTNDILEIEATPDGKKFGVIDTNRIIDASSFSFTQETIDSYLKQHDISPHSIETQNGYSSHRRL